LLCTEDDNSCYRNVCKMSVVSFALAVVFIIRLGLSFKNQDWIWKYDSPASIRISSDVFFPVVRLDFVFTENKNFTGGLLDLYLTGPKQELDWLCLVGRDERTIIFCTPDPVLIF